MLQDENRNPADTVKALDCLRGKFYSSYVRPSDKELAEAAKEKFRLLLDSKLDPSLASCVCMMDRVTFEALKEHEKEFFHELFDADTEEDLLEKEHALTLIRGKDKRHRFVIVASYFIAFTEDVSKSHRFQSIKDFIGALEMMADSGMVTEEHLDRERALCQSYLMGLTDDSDEFHGYRLARLKAMPKHLSLGPFSSALVGKASQNRLQRMLDAGLLVGN